MIKLDIISDPICPWCYIGKANLDRALGQHPDHPFSIEWHPFQLNPTMPVEGMDRREYLETKFGGRDKAIEVYARIDEAAMDAGLEINWDAITTTPNTLKAHRLIHWAGLEGRQTAAVSALFKAYFGEGRDIGDTDALLDVAESVGMDRAMTERLYASGADADDIQTRDTHARERGVTGVPTFVIANRHVVPGAQAPSLWTQIIEEIGAQLKAAE